MKPHSSKIAKSLIATFLLSVTSTSTLAEGLYFGAAIGAASTDIEFGDLSGLGDDMFEVSFSDKKDSDTSYNVFIGYDLTDYVGVEIAYVNLGEVGFEIGFDEAQSIASFVDIEGAGNSYIEVSGITAAIKGQLPLTDDLSVFAKLGTVQATLDISYTLNLEITSIQGFGSETSTVSESESSSEEDDAQFYSAGLSYDLGDIDLYAEYQVYDFEEAFNNAQVGIIFKF